MYTCTHYTNGRLKYNPRPCTTCMYIHRGTCVDILILSINYFLNLKHYHKPINSSVVRVNHQLG